MDSVVQPAKKGALTSTAAGVQWAPRVYVVLKSLDICLPHGVAGQLACHSLV
jgi:hypothetical protein